MIAPAGESTSQSSPPMTWWGRVAQWGAASLWLLAVAGLLIRFTIRDRYQPWSLLFYMTPIPMLTLLFLAAGWLWSRSVATSKPLRSRWCSLHGISLLAACLCAVWTWQSEFVSSAKPVPVGATRLLFWNVGHCRLGAKRIAAQIRQWDCPIVALVEADVRYKRTEEFWRTELAEYSTAMIHTGGLLAVKGEIRSKWAYQLTPLSWCNQFDLHMDGRDVSVLIVDIASHLMVSRGEALNKLAEIAATLEDRPVIIVGDFNTPDDSVWFESLRQQAKSGIRTVGSGYAATWPTPCPVLTLDQLWFNGRCDVYSCRSGWSMLSDHRPLFAELTVEPTAKRDESDQTRPE